MRRDRTIDHAWLERVRDQIEVDQARRRARLLDFADGGDGGMRHGDDFVVRIEAQGVERQMDGAGAGTKRLPRPLAAIATSISV